MTPTNAPGLAQPQIVVVPTATNANGIVKLRDPTPHFCNICDKDFHSDFNLKRHMRDYHSDAGANPNSCVREDDVSPMHIAAGLENDAAYAYLALLLKYDGGFGNGVGTDEHGWRLADLMTLSFVAIEQ